MIQRTLLTSLAVLTACTPSAESASSPNNPNRSAVTLQSPPEGSSTVHSPRFMVDFRSIDGTGNNLAHPSWGAVDQPFIRLAGAHYDDGLSSPASAGRPSARAVSNACSSSDGDVFNELDASDMLWQWGQFLDHDLDLTPEVEPEELFNVAIPAGDPWFDPTGSGEAVLPFHRSSYGVDDNGVRQQINVITAWIDASNVYGSDADRADALRAHDGGGHLLTSAGNLLPYNTAGLPNAAPPFIPAESLFLAGDFRANEQVALAAMHTLFVREHNRLADILRSLRPELSGDRIYQTIRTIVGAEMQAITYREFLPILLGPDALPPYDGYDPDVDPTISNEFAGAAYRVGHSMLSPQVLRLDENMEPIDAGPLSLADAFFAPGELETHGIEPILRGLTMQRAQRIDPIAVDEIRNMLFGPPGAGGLDLISLNLQRGRDHGLADYATLRAASGLSRPRRFSDISNDNDVSDALAAAYNDVDDIDAWIGLMAEDHPQRSLVGETTRRVLAEQFQRLRDGDAFWYERHLTDNLVRFVESRTLATIIRENTGIGDELGDPWHAPDDRDDGRGGNDGRGGGGPGGGGGGGGGPGGG